MNINFSNQSPEISKEKHRKVFILLAVTAILLIILALTSS